MAVFTCDRCQKISMDDVDGFSEVEILEEPSDTEKLIRRCCDNCVADYVTDLYMGKVAAVWVDGVQEHVDPEEVETRLEHMLLRGEVVEATEE